HGSPDRRKHIRLGEASPLLRIPRDSAFLDQTDKHINFPRSLTDELAVALWRWFPQPVAVPGGKLDETMESLGDGRTIIAIECDDDVKVVVVRDQVLVADQRQHRPEPEADMRG